jgi:glycosyltransferase involved in cell wall biosynthesis
MCYITAMKIVAIIAGEQAASTKYRLFDYQNFLENNGFEITYIPYHSLSKDHFKEIESADLVINQKCLIGRSFSKEIIRLSKRIIFDFDDALYTRPGKPYSLLTQWKVFRRLKFWLKYAHCVTVANHYLAHYANQFSSKVKVIPMALNLEEWVPKVKEGGPSIVMGWAGAPHNLWYLERLEPVLAKLLNRYPHLQLAIFSGKKPNLKIPYDYTPFSEGSEHAFIQKLDIGLLPLPDEEYSRGKSPIKAIQYLACGVPVVGNIMGATQEILDDSTGIHVESHEDWISAIEKLLQNESLRLRMGKAGRCLVEKIHNQSVTATQLMEVIKSL